MPTMFMTSAAAHRFDLAPFPRRQRIPDPSVQTASSFMNIVGIKPEAQAAFRFVRLQAARVLRRYLHNDDGAVAEVVGMGVA